jgi:hypothetical protein
MIELRPLKSGTEDRSRVAIGWQELTSQILRLAGLHKVPKRLWRPKSLVNSRMSVPVADEWKHSLDRH